MNLCLICYQQVEKGIRVPKWSSEQEDYIHRECLLIKLGELCQNKPEFEGKLKYLTQYEENNTIGEGKSLDYFGGTADVFWSREDVRMVPWDIKRLLDNKIISMLSAGRHPWYCLINRAITKKYLEGHGFMERKIIPDVELELPSDLFSTMIDYDELKELIITSLKVKMPLFRNFLFVGPPHSGKTTFLLELERIPGAFLMGGEAGPTRVGLRELLLSIGPRILLVDEIDKMDRMDREFLLGPADEYMRTGVVKHREIRNEKVDVKIFAAANPPKSRFSQQFLDRFWVVEFPQYSRDEFLEVSRRVLVMRREIENGLAQKISEEIWSLTKSIRDSLRVAEAVKSGMDLEKCLQILKKYRSK